MRFLKQNYKITSILLIALLFAYMGQLKDKVEEKVNNIVCSIKSEKLLNPIIPSFIKIIDEPGEPAINSTNYSDTYSPSIKIYKL